MNGREYAEHLGVPHGTIKRWLSEGLPAVRGFSGDRAHHVTIDPAAADVWVAEHRPNARALREQAFVYVASRSRDGAIKIGWTSDLVRRMRELPKGIKDAVCLLAAFPGGKPDELRLHARFAAYRIDGEWFRASKEITAWVESMVERVS